MLFRSFLFQRKPYVNDNSRLITSIKTRHEICFLSYQDEKSNCFLCFNKYQSPFSFFIIEGYIIFMYGFQLMFIMHKVKNFNGKKSHKPDENKV